MILECEPSPLTVAGCFPLLDGKWEVFGQRLTEVGRGTESFQATNSWKSIRSVTLSPGRGVNAQSYFPGGQGYVMVAVQDEQGRGIPGLEAERCVIRNEDRRDILLKRGDVALCQLAGKGVRLGFFLRSANNYAVTAGNNL